jgi:hypothetical protein
VPGRVQKLSTRCLNENPPLVSAPPLRFGAEHPASNMIAASISQAFGDAERERDRFIGVA